MLACLSEYGFHRFFHLAFILKLFLEEGKMSDKAIFVMGGFTTILLVGGLFFTFWEFRKMNQHPEKYENRK